MHKRVWFSHGKVIKNGFFCPFCNRHRTGRLIRDQFLWRVQMKCGHVRANLGLTQPAEELERKGYINTKYAPDPRYLAKVKQSWLDLANRRRALGAQAKAEDLFASHTLIHR